MEECKNNIHRVLFPTQICQIWDNDAMLPVSCISVVIFGVGLGADLKSGYINFC